ncbi:unnamed protein product [Heligmosomoides polygyrus]|uniref:Alpha-mann_mid domain-containing protein n=1 Tax=Heligmosomoides polygyrus TaxID=6339 RepID=A0A183FDI8_HELPZ|nr:unnamed protein product [Heligmosomoides polygyrus]
MTFVWAETIFLERWWRQQNDSVKADVRQLVKEGRLDLVTGSWVMTDEANPYYPVSVDNIIEGFQFIANEFGVKPSVLFTVDPFGHSNSIAYLYKQADQTGETAMLTHVLPYYHYDIPSSCGPSPPACCHIDFLRYYKNYNCFMEAAPVTKDNLQLKADTLSTQLKNMSDAYISDVVIMLYGDDFRFTTPFEWKVQYEGLRQVFDVINSQNAIDIRFGTISDFFKELENWYEKNDVRPPSLTGDFFPYKLEVASWTGYYTTRPFYKSQERRLHWLLRAADLLSSQAQHIVPRTDETLGKLEKARKALLLFQHHDAITGTHEFIII